MILADLHGPVDRTVAPAGDGDGLAVRPHAVKDARHGRPALAAGARPLHGASHADTEAPYTVKRSVHPTTGASIYGAPVYGTMRVQAARPHPTNRKPTEPAGLRSQESKDEPPRAVVQDGSGGVR